MNCRGCAQKPNKTDAGTARRLSVVSATSCARRRLTRGVSEEMREATTVLIACLFLGCANVPGGGESAPRSSASGAAEGSGSAKASPPEADFLPLVDRKFTSPSDGTIFQLTLGPSLENTGGVTEIPDGIVGMREATASSYTVISADGGGFGSAESSISEDFEERLDRIKIQHERESGRILVTENLSDGLPCKRYILFTPTHPGYDIEYLELRYKTEVFEVSALGATPFDPPWTMERHGELPQVILMPGGRAWGGW